MLASVLNLDTHLLIIILSSEKIVHDGDTVAELFAQSIQELVRVPTARGSGEGKELPTTGAGYFTRLFGGVRWAVQTDIRVGVHASRRRNNLLIVVVLRTRTGLLPRQR